MGLKPVPQCANLTLGSDVDHHYIPETEKFMFGLKLSRNKHVVVPSEVQEQLP